MEQQETIADAASVAASYLGEMEKLIGKYSTWWKEIGGAMEEQFGNAVLRSMDIAEVLSNAPLTDPKIAKKRIKNLSGKLENVIQQSNKLVTYYEKSAQKKDSNIVMLFSEAAHRCLDLLGSAQTNPENKHIEKVSNDDDKNTPEITEKTVKNFWLFRISKISLFEKGIPTFTIRADGDDYELSKTKEGDEVLVCEIEEVRAIHHLYQVTRLVYSEPGEPVEQDIDISFQIVRSFLPPISLDLATKVSGIKFPDTKSTSKLLKLSGDQFNRILSLASDAPEVTPLVVQNELKATTLDNDGATATVDLLDFTKDIRALATIMAMKDVKPPLAIALFGQWGTGKSFFMNQLRITINTLAQHQGFPQDPKQPVDPSQIKEKIFCEGVVQIEFNAWSYLDANLWAGLVSTIFERLDEYINDNVPGDDEREGVQKKLSEKLMIVSEQKRQVLNEKNNLTTKRDQLRVDIENAENDKTRLLEEIRKKTLDEIREKALQQLQPLPEQIKNKLIESGITEERLKELSPNALYDEVKSWVTFGRNLIQFNNREIFVFLLALTALLVLIIDPTGFFQEQMKAVGRGAMIILSFTGPLFVKAHNAFKKYKDLFSPILAFKNNFNERVQASEYDHQKKLHLLEAELSQNDSKLIELTDVLIGIDQEIAEVEHALKYSITKQAFFNFINKKNEDDAYAKHLGIISTVRRDFETLSNLFKGANESTGDEEKKNEEFRGYFKKPLDRIVLYVDDLDRCPDDKVMEVLQAVHLLMAFPLFIVVVGVDKRCVHNALAHRNLLQYSQYLKNGAFEQLEQLGINVIKPAEYLEKIFQIPFHLEEASDDNIKTMVDSLLKDQLLPDEQPETKTEKQPENEFKEGLRQLNKMTNNMLEAMTGVDDDGQPYSAEQKRNTVGEQKPAKQVYVAPGDLKLTAIELEYLREISALVGNTPRTIKRYINM